jgi:hypothetical protein
MSFPTRRGIDIDTADDTVKSPVAMIKGLFSGAASASSFGRDEESFEDGSRRPSIDFGLGFSALLLTSFSLEVEGSDDE